MSFATADVMDDQCGQPGSCDIQFRQYGGLAPFEGPISTVICFEDNELIRQHVSQTGGGRVLVVDGGGSLHAALVGENVATVALENGWAGLVIWGAVRDIAALRVLELGVKALGSNPRRSGRTGAGCVDVPVSFGGAIFRPGDRLFSDDDGVVVLDRQG